MEYCTKCSAPLQESEKTVCKKCDEFYWGGRKDLAEPLKTPVMNEKMMVKFYGIILLGAGIVLAVIAFFFFKVDVDITNAYSVVNLGQLNMRECMVIMAGFIAVIGMMLCLKDEKE